MTQIDPPSTERTGRRPLFLVLGIACILAASFFLILGNEGKPTGNGPVGFVRALINADALDLTISVLLFLTGLVLVSIPGRKRGG
jgi:hypothetical protein